MSDYLMHFNPFHDPKNGQFASGGSGTTGHGARKYQKQLNKLSDKNFKARAKYMKAAYKEDKYLRKNGRNGNSDKRLKLYQKRDRLDTEARKYQGMAEKILNEAKEKGYTVNSKEVVRDAAAGRKMAGYFFGGHIGYRIAENMYGGNKNSVMDVTKYKVRK